MRCDIKSLYLCVKDMERAILFYKKFFEKDVTVKDDVYSVFDINGFRLGLFAYEKMQENHVFGSNCLPSIQVEDINVLKSKIEGMEICFPLSKIGENWVVEIVDTEGNHIEITTPII